MTTDLRAAFAVLTLTFLIGVGGGEAWGKNPCAAKNPCGMANPCGVANPCAVANPCGMANPCAAANPCGMKNPCGQAGPTPIRRDHVTDKKALLKRGKALWESEKLGKSGLSCMTCHDDYEKLNLDNKEPWPRHVAMTGDIVTLDQMINFCVINPIAGEPLDSSSVDMTAMNAWYHEYVKGYKGE